MLSTGVSASLSNKRPAEHVCHAQQTHAKIASARIHLALAGGVEVIGLPAIGEKEQSALPGGMSHHSTMISLSLLVASRPSSDVLEW
jgi:hypothetical protein